ncbi:MAG: SPFH domain-containing protein [Clostridia bacterium]|jgi:membrane protease subunit (stomatin/prohibitin family)|nr:SPFH domain-containing protein [Clostridia bacterium]
MALFKKNPNEAAYRDGKKHWAEVIKNTGPGDLLIWKQPEEDFNTNSTLIVMPGEAAIFVNRGVVEQVFENGTYKLSTQNYPFISRLRNVLTGGISTFNCVVYFVKTAHTTEIKWGTDSPIQVRDKLLGIATKLKARGAYRVNVGNPAKFLEKMLGNNYDGMHQSALVNYFVSEFQSKIKSTVAKAINESNTEILGIDARLDEISDLIKPYFQEVLSDYGLNCVSFAIAAIDIDDSELRQKYDEIGMDAIAKMRNAQADRMVMDTLGDRWAQQQSVNIMSTLAEGVANGGGGSGLTEAGMGLGMGMAAGGMFGGMAQQMFAPMQQPMQPQAAPAPAQPQAAPEQDPMEVLSKLKKMLDMGLIEQSEYDAKKAEILSKM